MRTVNESIINIYSENHIDCQFRCADQFFHSKLSHLNCPHVKFYRTNEKSEVRHRHIIVLLTNHNIMKRNKTARGLCQIQEGERAKKAHCSVKSGIFLFQFVNLSLHLFNWLHSVFLPLVYIFGCFGFKYLLASNGFAVHKAPGSIQYYFIIL